jgi:Rrf2 family cysteine metabolism transcriptional repressor
MAGARMTLLSRKTDYALLILSYLQNHAEGGCARSIAAHFGLSRGFIANILKELCQKNFVVSHRGVKGGYGLARPIEEISLAELLGSLEDGFRLTNCTGHHDSAKEECSLSSTCPVKAPITELHRRIIGVFENVSLAEILKSKPIIETFQPILMTLPIREPLATGT